MDRADLERELEQMHEACWGWALACCGRDRDLAEDALQTSYLRILSGRARFDGRSALRTWVFGVIRRTAMEELRANRTRRSREDVDAASAPDLSDPAPGADVRVERSDERAALLAALSALSSRQREVLELVFYHGLTVEEAAAVMQISVGSARTHYDRGKKALAIALAPEFAPVPRPDGQVAP
ncbi:MAG: RNA polymerase sigma factor [Gemmatimonadaceae bacterium]